MTPLPQSPALAIPAVSAPARPALDVNKQIRVLVVDDSVVMRRLLTRILTSDPAFEVVGAARDGNDALAKVTQLQPDLVTLDVEMPGMDGLEALRLIQAQYPNVRVIMCSSITERGAAVTIDALMAGASDYVTKQHSAGLSDDAYGKLQVDLLAKIHGIFDKKRTPPPHLAQVTTAGPRPTGVTQRVSELPPGATHTSLPFVPGARPFTQKLFAPQILAIGVSTGGPSALAEILPLIPSRFPLPIVIVQHMPPFFTQLLAERLSRLSCIPVVEGLQGMKVQPGTAIIAPGNYHMRLVRRLGGGVEVELNQQEQENSCRPAVDVLFRSIAEVYGGAAIAAILTGMGQDGLLGVRALKALGVPVLAQDKATSVVWGMPGAVVDAQLADAVLPLRAIIPEILRRL